MSKISLTVCIPHEKKDGKIKPQFYVSCSNNSYLSVNGKDIRGARWGNSNVNQGYKNRFEYGCTAAKGITNLSLIMNTSTILPPLSWALNPSKPAPKKDEKEKKKRDGSKDSERSRTSHPSRHNGQPNAKDQAKLTSTKFHHRPHINCLPHQPASSRSDSTTSHSTFSSRPERQHRRDREARRLERDESPPPARIEDCSRDHDRERYEPRQSSHRRMREDDSSRDSSSSTRQGARFHPVDEITGGGHHHHRHHHRKKRKAKAVFNPAFGDP